MKIALYDPYGGKFTSDMVEWWRNQGHDVRVDRYYDPEIAWDADMIWFDTCDNNLLSATNPSQALLADPDLKQPWSLHDIDLTNKKVVVRPIDIEVWQGHHAYDNMWNVVDECIFIAPHIRDMMMADSRPQQSNMNIHTVPCAVNLDRWTFKERKPGFNIAVVGERWESKGSDIIPQIALKLKQIDERYHIHWLGKWSEYHWDKAWLEDFIVRNDLPITFYDWADSVDEFLEDKDYLLSASKKEAFGYNIAEAMAKGIRPVIHAFYGYEPLWGDSPWVWNGIDEAIDMFTDGEYDSSAYREYLIKKGYTLESMMNSFNKIIGV